MTKSIKHLKDQLKGLSTRSALATLGEKYGMSGKSFIFDGQLYTVSTALSNIPGYLLDMACDEFGTIRFYGGPPAVGAWYEGSILTMLCDAVLFEENTRHLDTSQKLMA